MQNSKINGKQRQQLFTCLVFDVDIYYKDVYVLETFSACGRNCSAIDLTSLGCRQGQFERPFFQWSGSQRVSPRPSWPHCELKDQCRGWAKSSSDIFRDLSFQSGWQLFPYYTFQIIWFLFLEIWRTWRLETENIFVFWVLVKCILSRHANSEEDFASIFSVNTIRLPIMKDSNLNFEWTECYNSN